MAPSFEDLYNSAKKPMLASYLPVQKAKEAFGSAEEALLLVKGGTATRWLIAVLTSENVHILGLGYKESFQLKQLTGITRKYQIGAKWTIEFSRASNVDVLSFLDERESEVFYNTARELMANLQSAPTVVAVSASPAENPLEQIKKLKELLDLGLITDEEFQEKKKILMGKIS